MTTSDVLIDADPSTTPAAASVNSRIRTLIPVVSAGLALILFGSAAVFSVSRAGAVSDARAAAIRADQASDEYWAARFALADAVSAATALAALDTLVPTLDGGVDPAASTALLAQLAELRAEVESDGVQTPQAGPGGQLPSIDDDGSIEAALAATAAADERATAWADAATQVRSAESGLTELADVAVAGWLALADGAPAAVTTLISANSSAVAGTQTAVTDAAAVLATHPADRVKAITAYASAIAGLKKSHADEQARIAAEAAAAAEAAKKKRSRTPWTPTVLPPMGPACGMDPVTGGPVIVDLGGGIIAIMYPCE